MKWLNLIAKTGRKSHTCKLWFHLLRSLLPHQTVALTTQEAELVMSQHYPDQGSSCIRINNIETHQPSYDLEVIIPVYNAVDYLRACVDSVLHQKTSHSIHVTLVDDGSNDGSKELCNEYAQRQNVKVVHQSNQGVSVARNHALSNLDSRYVMFVDADDILPEKAVNTLLDKAEESHADIVEGGIETFEHDFRLKGNRKSLVTHEKEGIADMLSGFPVSKVFRSEVFRNIIFPEHYRYEDTIFSFIIYPQAKRKVCIHETTYYYRQHKASFTAHESGNYATLDAYWVVKRLLHDIQSMFKESETFSGEYDKALLFEAFLQSMKLSGSRMACLGEETSTAYFAAMCNCMEQYRSLLTPFGHSTLSDQHHQQALRTIHQAVLKHDYTAYLLACHLL